MTHGDSAQPDENVESVVEGWTEADDLCGETILVGVDLEKSTFAGVVGVDLDPLSLRCEEPAGHDGPHSGTIHWVR